MEIRTGCSGWSYDSWKGPFYSSGTENKAMLAMYARVFNVVEIDSTFYRVPEDDVIESWKSNTPPDFLFCPKMPGALTHDGRLLYVAVTRAKTNLILLYNGALTPLLPVGESLYQRVKP